MSRPFVPHDYQRDMIDFVRRNQRGGLWAGMGTGKCVATMTGLLDLDLFEPVFPALVLAPLRVANSTWSDDAVKWSHTEHLRVVPIAQRSNPLVSATASERKARLSVPGDIYTLPYGSLSWLVDTLGGDWPFKTVIGDEVSRLQSFRIRQGGKHAAALGKVAHTEVDRFIGLTGSPGARGLKGLWGTTWFYDKGERLGRTFTAFEQRWFRKGFDGFSLEPLPHAQEEIQGLLKDICLTVKGLPVDAPITNTLYVDMPPSAQRHYKSMEKELFADIGEHGVEAANAAVRSGKLLQLTGGNAFLDETGAYEAIHDAKLDALESVIEEANGMPVLVAYNFVPELKRILKRFPTARHLDADPKTIKRWNAGDIPVLVAHPACLHPATEVLTEFRGWVKIVDVRHDERVFDGVEFVSHSGCSFSGVRPVIEAFGLVLTPSHKLLVGQDWAEAKDVRNSEEARRKARYAYEGYAPYLSAMLPLRRGAQDTFAERGASQQGPEKALPLVHRGDVPPDDGNAILVDLERYERAGDQPRSARLPNLRRCRQGTGEGVARLSEFLPRYVSDVPRRSDDRAEGQLQGIQQRKLSLGNASGAAVKQEQQSGYSLPRPGHASGRVLPGGGSGPRRDISAVEQGDVCGGSLGELRSLDVQEEPEIARSEVYDLVNCGPRSRFVVRNADGEVFVSHNSCAHGLNLQDGGNILAFYGSNWDLENDEQIIERIGPMRQKQSGYDRPVFVHRIVARGTIDEDVLERLTTKRSVQSILLAAMERRG